ncbi:MAG: ribonuclease P protein component [Acetomicrobium sp.]
MSYRYPRSVRLRRREEFDLLFREGKRARGAYVRMLYIKAPEGAGTRIGVAVGKKQENRVFETGGGACSKKLQDASCLG